MVTPYYVRLVCLVLAAFVLVHTTLAALVALVAQRVAGRTSAMQPRAAARLLLVVRLTPLLGAFLVVVVASASYLLYEPPSAIEELAPACLVAAILGASMCVSGVIRIVGATIRSARFLRKCHSQNAPVFLMTGIFRRRVTVTASMRTALTAAEFDVAMRHEEAHARSWDNLKRLLILGSPAGFPFAAQFRILDAAWRRMTEFAADDEAVAGSSKRALTLAFALVRASRVSGRIPSTVMATPLLAGPDELASRVQRLLEFRASAVTPKRRRLEFVWMIAAGLIAVCAPLLPVVHRALETLAR